MRFGIAVLTLLSVVGCQPGSAPLGADRGEEPPAPPESPGDAAVTLVVSLTQASQGASPVGLPTRFEVTGRLPDAGQVQSIVWRALDGDPQRPPRTGIGTATLASDGERLTLRLRRTEGPDDEALVLTGAPAEAGIRGSFTDRLFFVRAGLFEARRE